MNALEKDALPGALLDPLIARLRSVVSDFDGCSIVEVSKALMVDNIDALAKCREALLMDEAPATTDLIALAREIEGMKRECGMDPESPTALYNGRLMTISYKLRDLAARIAKAPEDEAAERPRIDANALEAMAKERPNEKFLKGSGILKLIGGIRQLERENRELRAALSTPSPAPEVGGAAVLLDMVAHLAGAASAYRTYAKRHASHGKAETDAFFSTRIKDMDAAVERGRAALQAEQHQSAIAAPQPAADVMGVLAELRADGWAVAVHNDYRLNGEAFTFWLLTKGDRFIKGEGRTDAEALESARRALAAGADAAGAVPEETMEQKNARNRRVQSRYDELMAAGKHGHYETMFRIVREEVEAARLASKGEAA